MLYSGEASLSLEGLTYKSPQGFSEIEWQEGDFVEDVISQLEEEIFELQEAVEGGTAWVVHVECWDHREAFAGDAEEYAEHLSKKFGELIVFATS